MGRSRPQAERAVGRPRGDEADVGSVHEHGSGGVSEETGCTQVVIAGVATSIGIESTARQAHERGFNVTLAIDAMTETSPDSHVNSITRIFPKLRNWHDPGNHRSPRGETRDRARPASCKAMRRSVRLNWFSLRVAQVCADASAPPNLNPMKYSAAYGVAGIKSPRFTGPK